MKRIGVVKRVQVQRNSLKAGVKPHRYYDPSPIYVVETLSLTPEGVVGTDGTGETLVDVHNIAHPQSRNRGDNHISINFTGHYDFMQQYFGEHLITGCAGENILVEYEGVLTPQEVARGLAFRCRDGQTVALIEVIPAPPCVEFSRFALDNLDADAHRTKQALQTLDNGTRGFYAKLAVDTATVRAGDELYRLD